MTTTTETHVEVRGSVADASSVELRVGGEPVPLEPDHSFRVRIPLELGEERRIAIEARDAAGNHSAVRGLVLRRVRAPAPWEQDLAAALDAVVRDDADEARSALARAEAAGVPLSKAKAVTEYLRVWDLPPTLTVQSPASGATIIAAPDGSFSFRVRATLISGHMRDQLLLDGRQVLLPATRALDQPYPVEAIVERASAGPTTVQLLLRGPGGTRAEAVIAVNLEPMPIVEPRGTSGDAEKPPPAASALPGTGPSLHDMGALEEVNRARAQRGLAAIRFDRRLHAAARAHSVEQLRDNFLGHDSKDPGRAKLGQRMQQAGYVGRMYAEVVAKDYATAREVVQAWLESPSHSQVLLDPELMEGAIARVDSADGRRSRWTGDFGTQVAAWTPAAPPGRAPAPVGAPKPPSR